MMMPVKQVSDDTLLDELAAIVGVKYVIGPNEDLEPYLVDWRGRYHARGDAESESTV